MLLTYSYPLPPLTTTGLSEYLINPSELNNSQSVYIVVNFSISAGKLEQRPEAEGQGRGIFSGEKLLFQLSEMLAGNQIHF